MVDSPPTKGVLAMRNQTITNGGLLGFASGIAGALLANSDKVIGWLAMYERQVTVGLMILLVVWVSVFIWYCVTVISVRSTRTRDRKRRKKSSLLVWRKLDGKFRYQDASMGEDAPELVYALANEEADFVYYKPGMNGPRCTAGITKWCGQEDMHFTHSGEDSGYICARCETRYSKGTRNPDVSAGSALLTKIENIIRSHKQQPLTIAFSEHQIVKHADISSSLAPSAKDGGMDH